jgi:hypothetical protein
MPGKRVHRERWFCQALVVCAAGVCVVTMVACAGSAGDSQANASQVTQVASQEHVALLPNLGAGDGGWCMTTLRGAGGCPSLDRPVFRGPIVMELWSGQSSYFEHGLSSSPEGSVSEGFVLTTSEVASVSFEGGKPIATYAETVLPDHLRGAILDLRKRHASGVIAPPAVPHSHFTALNAKGEPILQTHAAGPPLDFNVPSRSWGGSATQPAGVCRVEAKGLAGLVSQGGCDDCGQAASKCTRSGIRRL